MTLPKRPAQHVIDDLAMDALSSAIHHLGWVLRRLPADYGVDAEIEIRDKRCQMTGGLVRVQVKGTSAPNAIAHGVTIKVRTIRYWLVSPIPVFIVCVVKPRNKILIANVEDHLIEHHKVEYIQNTSRKTFRFKLSDFTPLSEYADILRDRALEHQDAVLDTRNYSLYNPAAQLVACVGLIYHFDGDIDTLLSHLRKNGSDQQLTYDYGYYALLKKRLKQKPDYINEIRRWVDSCAPPDLLESAKQARSTVRRDEASV